MKVKEKERGREKIKEGGREGAREEKNLATENDMRK